MGLDFKVFTDKDFMKINFNDVRNHPDIKWIEKSFSYFRKT